MAVEESVAPKASETAPPMEGKSVPPPPPVPPVPPTLPAVDPDPSSDRTVIPPASDKNVCLPSTEETHSNTHPPPVLDNRKPSMTEEPSTQELLQQFDNTPPSLRPRPSDAIEWSDSPPSATEGRKQPLQSKRVKMHQPKTSYKSSPPTTIHGSGRKKTRPTHAGMKKLHSANQFAPLDTIDEEH